MSNLGKSFMGRFEEFFYLGIVGIGVAAFMSCFLILLLVIVGDIRDDAKRKLEAESWEGAAVARICADGTRVYKLKSGEYKLFNGYSVIDVQTVCPR